MPNSLRKSSMLLKDLSTQLQDAGRTETDTIDVNTTTIAEELQTLSEAGEEQLEAVNHWLHQEREKVRKGQQSERCTRAKACDAPDTRRLRVAICSREGTVLACRHRVQPPDTWQVPPSECLLPHDTGACPWWVCMLKNHWRHGPNA